MTPYTLIRSQRKTLSVGVEWDLTVLVRAPMHVSREEIDRFVASHEDWIRRQMARLAVEAAARNTFHYADGDAFPFGYGELVLATGSGHKTVAEGGRLLLPQGCDRPREVELFLREEARRLVDERVRRYAPRLNVTPSSVKITTAATRWGSCSGKGGLCFSWRVACLPGPLVDYIIVHELSHIREHNHSARFWRIVEEFFPNHKDCRARLREFHRRIPF